MGILADYCTIPMGYRNGASSSLTTCPCGSTCRRHGLTPENLTRFNAVVQPQIKINFSVVTTESYILRVNAYYPSQYALTSIGSGQTSSRVVTFLPTISTIAR